MDGLIPLALLLFFSWGFGNLVTSITKKIGWNTRLVFWISSVTFGVSVILLIPLIPNDGPYLTWLICTAFLLAVGVVIFKLAFAKSVGKSVSSTNNEADFNRIFISYRRSDSNDIAGRLYDRLVDDFGKETVFKDVDSIPAGVNFKEHLNEQVGKCNVLLAIIGDRWLDASDATGNRRLEDPSDFVRIEIELALNKNIPVIPLLVRGASMPSEESLPSGLRKLVFMNGIPIRPDPDFHRDMDRLIKALEVYV